jgi:hypothetical protein
MQKLIYFLMFNLMFYIHSSAQVNRWKIIQNVDSTDHFFNIFCLDSVLITRANIGFSATIQSNIRWNYQSKQNGSILKSDTGFTIRPLIDTYYSVYSATHDWFCFDNAKLTKDKKYIYSAVFKNQQEDYDVWNEPSYFVKTNTNTLGSTYVPFGDSFRTNFAPTIVELNPNKIAVGITKEWVNNVVPAPAKMGIIFFDSNLVQTFYDTFAASNREYITQMVADNRGNLYLAGYNVIPPQQDHDETTQLVKKIDSNGHLINSVTIEAKIRRQRHPFIVNNFNAANDKLLVVNGFKFSQLNCNTHLKFIYLDTNLNVLKIDSLKPNMSMVLHKVIMLRNGDLLMAGTAFSATNKTFVWAMRTDSLRNVRWDKAYKIADSGVHDVEDATVDEKDGSIYMCGVVGRLNYPQSGFIIKLDSNGCLDDNQCWPMSVQEYIEPKPSNMLQVYPNPATSNIIVEFNSLNDIGGTCTIHSTDGKLVKQYNNLQYKNNYNLSDLQRGVYWLRYHIGERWETVKVVLE